LVHLLLFQKTVVCGNSPAGIGYRQALATGRHPLLTPLFRRDGMVCELPAIQGESAPVLIEEIAN